MSTPAEQRPTSRRVVLKGAAAGAGLAAAGIATASSAHAADGDRPESVTARLGGTSITLSLAGGALRWSARRGGRTVIGTSALGLRLGDGTVLGNDVRPTGHRHRTHRSTWTPVYGRNATVTDHYQEQRWDLRDRASGIRFGVQIRAYKTGVALRYVLLDQGTATIADELTTFVFPDGTTVYRAR